MDSAVLETKELSFLYSKGTSSEVAAINNINIKINKGELVGIIGHTGSGKSTLVEHFNAILKPTGGSVFLDGNDIWQDKKNIRSVRFKVGVCFQYPEYQLFEDTVEKDVAFGPKNMGLSKNEIDLRVREAIGFVGLNESYLEKSPFDLSGGEKRRVAIAGVMAMKPEVLVLDEPCAGLDPIGRKTVLDLIVSYKEKTNSTVIVVSHSMEDIAKIATKILVMNESRLAYYDTVRNVFSHVSELVSMGLDVPQITQLFLKLKNAGYDVRTDIYTADEAEKELLKLLKRRGNNAQ
ncbi:MAG: energy-coupling factor transporter ATPase [Oscillospiraceae bacterium]|nr:energy-coupling factor transporter ATPase [Oscillospiraceae bacterium]MDD7293123.1 energy-coupling factor transporter ATPase [Clostridiaceae bacterium]MDY5992069.1 energy-coupling factor transporter ATPase [Oscillospiraceae bacterium]